jgi:hypothetical protein
MYYIDNEFTRSGRTWAAVVVGCGGTGGYVAEALVRLLPQNVQIILVDFDRVEERNLIRQNFFREDVGKYKSVALAERLTQQFDRPVSYSTLPVQELTIPKMAIVVGCVDNGIARATIAGRIPRQYSWWVDAGNGENFGQVLIGNSKIAEFHQDREVVSSLPLPSIQRPEILLQAPPTLQPNCLDVSSQGPTINQVMAALTVEVVRRLYLGTCPWIQLMVDMEHGTMTPIMATPENCREIMHTKSKDKVRVHREEKGG